MPSRIGVPIKLLHEAEGHKVTVEMTNGQIFRGVLQNAEDSMNVTLQGVTFTDRDGRVSKLESVYLRGSKVRFFLLPEMLKHAPMFKRFDPKNKEFKKASGQSRIPLDLLLVCFEATVPALPISWLCRGVYWSQADDIGGGTPTQVVVL